MLLGVRAVLAVSYERIHRSNLIGMGVLPLEFPTDSDADSLGLTGEEVFDITGVTALADAMPETVHVTARRADGSVVAFDARVRIDTPGEAAYYRHGGILPYVLRSLRDA
jgi:aconitate hydratase